jgi:glycosyltransferase involved in cell wall biosynthesis
VNILLVSQHYPPDTARGGIGTQAWNKAHALARLGHMVHVLSCADGGRPAEDVTEAGIQVHRLPGPGSEEGREFPIYSEAAYWLAYSTGLLPELNRLIETAELDVIDFPEYGGEGFAYQLDRTPEDRVPVVVQLYAPLDMLAEHMGWPEPGSSFHQVGSFMESSSILLADGLTACSANIADFAALRYGVSRQSIDVVYCGVDAEVFHPAADGERTDGRPTVLFVGNVAPSKGVEAAFDAVLQLRGKYPDILLRIAGPGDGLGEELLARAEEAGAGANIELAGFVGRDELPELYRRADVFCSPAQYEGGVATVYCEAMACGCPVVASTAGGAPEAVVEGETGLLVPPLDVDATAEALDRILGDPALRRRMAESSRLRAEELFAMDKVIARIVAAYEQAIDRSRRRLELRTGVTA